MNRELTRGAMMPAMLRFAVPIVLGNLLQQCYNGASMMIVGRYLGSGVAFSIRFGQQDDAGLGESVRASFLLIAALTLALNLLAFAGLDLVWSFLRIPPEVWSDMRAYL